MQNSIPKFRQSSYISEKPGYLSDQANQAISRRAATTQSLIFVAEILHMFPT